MRLPRFHIRTGNGAAWRALYLYAGPRSAPGYQVAHIGIDPTFHAGHARLFCGVSGRKDCTGGRKAQWIFRAFLPRCRHWYLLDGRRNMTATAAIGAFLLAIFLRSSG